VGKRLEGITRGRAGVVDMFLNRFVVVHGLRRLNVELGRRN
jgi:hypothetical protein